jgi:hypothetical protein
MNALEKYAAKRRLTMLLKEANSTVASAWAKKAPLVTNMNFKKGSTITANKPTGGASNTPAQPKLPNLGGQKANAWTTFAKTNAQRTGATGRADYNTRSTQPVTQSTQAGAGRKPGSAIPWPATPPAVANR